MALARARLAVIVLAAGAGTRFSDEAGAKLLAPLDGRPVLEHVLAAVRSFAPRTTIVVLGQGAHALERSIDWAGEERLRNSSPERGLASSIRTGLGALAGSAYDGAYIVLGDQPQLRADVLQALADAAEPDARPIIVPRYDEPGPRNPVLLLRSAWTLTDDVSGDHGLAALIDARPGLVRTVAVSGRMPDVDRPEDLASLRRDLG